MSAITTLLRGKSLSGDPAKKPLEMQGDGYAAYVREARSMGEQAVPYEQWIASQSPISKSR
jgi:hypothetical protein